MRALTCSLGHKEAQLSPACLTFDILSQLSHSERYCIPVYYQYKFAGRGFHEGKQKQAISLQILHVVSQRVSGALWCSHILMQDATLYSRLRVQTSQ